MAIEQSDSHDEATRVAFRRQNELDAGSRTAVDQSLNAENFSQDKVKAEQESVRQAEVEKDVSNMDYNGGSK